MIYCYLYYRSTTRLNNASLGILSNCMRSSTMQYSRPQFICANQRIALTSAGISGLAHGGAAGARAAAGAARRRHPGRRRRREGESPGPGSAYAQNMHARGR